MLLSRDMKRKKKDGKRFAALLLPYIVHHGFRPKKSFGISYV